MEDLLYPNSFPTPFAGSIYHERYEHPEDVNWTGTTKRVVTPVMGSLYKAPNAQKHVSWISEATDRVGDLMGYRKFCPGGRYLYGAGRDLHQVNNCLLLRCPDSREGWAETSWNAEMALMTGAGIGVWYGDLRPAGAYIKRTGGESGGPLSKMRMVNEIGREVLSGGNRRGAIWAGLPWWHADIFDFIISKNWSEAIKQLKAEDHKFRAPLDTTNMSVTLDDAFFHFMNGSAGLTHLAWFGEHGYAAPDGGTWEAWASRVYASAVSHMVAHGEPGFTVDVGEHADEVCRNACTEVTSADDSDVCNIGSLVLPRFDSPAQFGQAVRDAVLFLTGGSVYSHVPYPKVEEVRDKNRRLSLGLMGGHELVMRHGAKYGTDDAHEILLPYLEEYGRALEYARDQQERLGLTLSIGATGVAPNGTTGALMETTPSFDPMLTAAEVRQVKVAKGGRDDFDHHVIVDPTAQRLVAEGIDPDSIEDAYTISTDPERRIKAQAFVQGFTDHGISSTVNLYAPLTDEREVSDFGDMLLGHLPDLRGITCYPDGARAGQPRKPCDLAWALEREGVVLQPNEESCVGGACGA